MQGISIALLLAACALLLGVVFVGAAATNDQLPQQGEVSKAERRGGLFAFIALMFLCAAGLVEYLAQPVVYYSNKAMVQTGKKVCAFVDTQEGKKPCSAFTEKEIRHMEEAWAE